MDLISLFRFSELSPNFANEAAEGQRGEVVRSKKDLQVSCFLLLSASRAKKSWSLFKKKKTLLARLSISNF